MNAHALAADTARRPVTVRVGIPLPGGQLIAHAREQGHAVLFSANAFAVYDTRGEDPKSLKRGLKPPRWFKRFRLPDPAEFGDVDVALDSGGFVAAVTYRDFPWTVDDYIELAASYPWSFWAAMDMCVESEVADNRAERMLRIAATSWNLFECGRAAKARGIKPPMPVLQGWTPEDYAFCADILPLGEWPDLVGIGSVCRREVGGENGILRIFAALDQIVPPHVRFHLFGVKSGALAKLLGHPRLESIDSMAWDGAVRREVKDQPRTMAIRMQYMDRWAEKQKQIAAGPASNVYSLADWGYSHGLFSTLPQRMLSVTENLLLEALTDQYVELVRFGEVDYMSARMQMDREAFAAISTYRVYGASCLDRIDDVVPGLSQYVEARLVEKGQSGQLALAA